MPHTTLKPFEFTYNRIIPRVSIGFFNRNGTFQGFHYEKFDTGATNIFIPRHKALEWDLRIIGTISGNTATNETNYDLSHINFRLGTEDDYVGYTNIPVCILDGSNAQILIGIRPIWQDYIVTINAHTRTVNLEPR
jgi:hypothetical protein